MRQVVVWVALLGWAPVATAQVAFERRDPKDEQVARALEQLVDRPVALVDAAGGGEAERALPRVSIDRSSAVVRVVTRANPAGLARELDPTLLASSPYAVALAVAELLDLSPLVRERARRTGSSSPQAATGSTASPAIVRAPPRAEPLVVPERAPLPPLVPEPDLASKSSREPEPEPEPEPTIARSADSTAVTEPQALREPVAALASARAVRRSELPDFAFGVDLELQTQPGHDLSFVRPALYGELAWGRGVPGGFWAAGARVSAPLARALQPTAAGIAEGARVGARAFDAALQASLGYAFASLGLAAYVAAGLSYLRVEALDAAARALGHDPRVSPLFAAGLGARLPVAFGFSLAVRGEAQWAGPDTIYRVGGEPVLATGAFRAGFLAGVLWESAYARARP